MPRPPAPDPECFEDGKQQAAKGLLNVANILAETVDAMPEDETPDDTKFRAFLWDTIDLCRKMADKISPPGDCFPAKVISMAGHKRKR